MRKKVLIVDDEVELADLIASHFALYGWETNVAENGKVALEKLVEFNPDVIVSDISMPVMNGMVLLEQLYNRGIDIPLIYITSFRDVEKMKKAWGLCAFDFLDKPFEFKAMIQVAESAYDFGREYVRSARKRYFKRRKVS